MGRSVNARPANLPRPGGGDATRVALVDAARAEFTARGYRATTVEAIATAAGFTKGAFYRHFPSKAAAYAAVLEQAAGAAWRNGLSRMAAAPTVADAVATYVSMVAAFHQRAPFRISTIVEAISESEHDPGLRSSTATAFQRARDRLAETLAAAAEREGVALPGPAETLAGSLIGHTIGAVAQWKVDPDGFDLDEWARVASAVMTSGLRSLTGGT